MSQPHVVTVILNVGRCDDILACLDSLYHSTYSNHSVLVMDVATTDGSVATIERTFPHAEIVLLKENLGYAGNNNVGIKLALERGAEWIFLLNDDTVVAPDCLEHLVTAARNDAAVGIVGPLVYHADEPHVIQSAGGWMDERWQTGHIGQNQVDSEQFLAVREVDWISGCAIMVRRRVIEEIGVLDEAFFCYFEETEWCLRARNNGWRLLNVPAAKIWHKGVRRDYKPKPPVAYYMTRNLFMMLSKHHAPVGAWVRAWAQTLRTLTSYTLKPKWRDKRAHRNAMWRGAVDFLQGRTGRMP